MMYRLILWLYLCHALMIVSISAELVLGSCNDRMKHLILDSMFNEVPNMLEFAITRLRNLDSDQETNERRLTELTVKNLVYFDGFPSKDHTDETVVERRKQLIQTIIDNMDGMARTLSQLRSSTTINLYISCNGLSFMKPEFSPDYKGDVLAFSDVRKQVLTPDRPPRKFALRRQVVEGLKPNGRLRGFDMKGLTPPFSTAVVLSKFQESTWGSQGNTDLRRREYKYFHKPGNMPIPAVLPSSLGNRLELDSLMFHHLSAFFIETLSVLPIFVKEHLVALKCPDWRIPGSTAPEHPARNFLDLVWLAKNRPLETARGATIFKYLVVSLYLNSHDWSQGYMRKLSESQVGTTNEIKDVPVIGQEPPGKPNKKTPKKKPPRQTDTKPSKPSSYKFWPVRVFPPEPRPHGPVRFAQPQTGPDDLENDEEDVDDYRDDGSNRGDGAELGGDNGYGDIWYDDLDSGNTDSPSTDRDDNGLGDSWYDDLDSGNTDSPDSPDNASKHDFPQSDSSSILSDPPPDLLSPSNPSPSDFNNQDSSPSNPSSSDSNSQDSSSSESSPSSDSPQSDSNNQDSSSNNPSETDSYHSPTPEIDNDDSDDEDYGNNDSSNNSGNDDEDHGAAVYGDWMATTRDGRRKRMRYMLPGQD